MNKRWKSAKLWVFVAVAICGIGGYGLVRYRAAKRNSRVRFETVKIERGRIVAKVTATGTLSALVSVQVGSQVSGRIKEIFVDFNSPVKKGQVLARIDPQLFDAALQQAHASFVAAKGDLAAAKAKSVDAARQSVRAAKLAERKLVAEADRDTAQATAESAAASVASAEGRLEQAKAALNQAVVNLAYTTISSPIDGTVVSRNVDVGQTVAASLQAPTLFLLAENLHSMQVDTSVAEADVGKLAAGMEAQFGVDAYPGEQFFGKVRQIRNAPQTVQNVVTYDAVIDVQNPELKLRPGMTATVTFVYAERESALRVPNSALRFRMPALAGPRRGDGPGAGTPNTEPPVARRQAPSLTRQVWVLRDDKPHPVSIKLGVSDGTYTEAVSGDLREGDSAITEAIGGAEARGPGGPGGPFHRLM